MSEVANIFDNGPISLIARIKDNISVYTAKNGPTTRSSTLSRGPVPALSA